MKRKRNIIVLLSLAVLAACSGRYVGMPRAEVLSYQTTPTYGGLHALATSCAESLNAAIKVDTLHPGMYAEYGITLALMGHKGAACRMLNAEALAFPESRGMIRRIKEHLLPDMVADTFAVPGDTANIAQLASWAYDSLTALQPLPYVAPVIDSTDSAWISQQTPVDSVVIPIRLTANQKRELLAQQQAAQALRQKAVADSLAAEKKAKAKAKEAEREAKKKQREEERKRKATERKANKKSPK